MERSDDGMRSNKDQEALTDLAVNVAVAIGLNLIFLVLATLACWWMQTLSLIPKLGLGILAYAGVVLVAGLLVTALVDWLNWDDDPPGVGFIVINLVVSGTIQLFWSAYLVSVLYPQLEFATFLVKIGLFSIGFVASFLGQVVTTVWFKGEIYAISNMLIAILSFVLFFALALMR